ncbi:MAG: AAA family ATPase [Nitrososphaerales archaeon]
MFSHISISNFRGIKEGEINLGQLNILLGPNNSGKTTILEALFLVPNPLRYSSYIPLSARHSPSPTLEVFYLLHQALGGDFIFLFYNYTSDESKIKFKKDEREFTLLFTKRDLYFIDIVIRGPIDIPNSVNIPRKDDGYFIGTLRRDIFEFSSNYVKPVVDNTFLITPSLIRQTYSTLRNNWIKITNEGISGKVAEEASRFSDEDYIDLTIEPFIGAEEILAYLKDKRRIRIRDLGEGIHNYIISRILYELEKPAVLLWDDIEAHFNPRILSALAEWFSDILKDGKQIVLSTHSLEAAKIIAGFNEDKANIFLTSLKDNILKTKKLKLSEVEELLKAGVDIRLAEPFLL